MKRNLFRLLGIGLFSIFMGLGGIVYADTPENCFTFDSTTQTITKYDFTCGTDVVIPSSIGGVEVQNIGPSSFNSSSITNESIKLTSVTIPSSVKVISVMAFAWNKLENIVIPSSIKVIGENAFSHNRLKSVYFPDGLERIEDRSFEYNMISNITIPQTIKYVGNGAFNRNLLSDNQAFLYKWENGIEDRTKIVGYGGKNKNPVIPNGVISIEGNAFTISKFDDTELQLESVTIPDSMENIAVRAFAQYGSKYNLPRIIIGYVSWDPTDITNKDKKKSFEGTGYDLTYLKLVQRTSLVSVDTITNTEIEVENGTDEHIAKGNLPTKGKITDDEGNQYDVDLRWSIENYNKNIAGEYIATAIFDLPANIENTNNIELKYTGKITVKAFNCFEFDETTQTITAYKYSNVNCGTDVTVPELINGKVVKKIGNDVFNHEYHNLMKKLTSVILPNTLEEIGHYSLRGNKFTTVTIPGSIKVVGTGAFQFNDKLTTVILKEGVKELKGQSFFKDNNQSSRIKNIIIPNSLEKVGSSPFGAFCVNGDSSLIVTGYVGWDPNDIANKNKKEAIEGIGDHKTCLKLVQKEIIVHKESTETTSTNNKKAKIEYTSSVEVIVKDGSNLGNAGYNAINTPAYSNTKPASFTDNNTEVKGVVTLSFAGGGTHATFSKPIKIQIPVDANSYVKVNHGNGFGTIGLSLDANTTCNNGESNNKYNGSIISEEGGYITFYTCSASVFVAYTKTSASSSGEGSSSSSSSSSYSGGGGGGGYAIHKDKCPNGDNSISYYDGTCGVEKEVKGEKAYGKVLPIEKDKKILKLFKTVLEKEKYKSKYPLFHSVFKKALTQEKYKKYEWLFKEIVEWLEEKMRK